MMACHVAKFDPLIQAIVCISGYFDTLHFEVFMPQTGHPISTWI